MATQKAAPVSPSKKSPSVPATSHSAKVARGASRTAAHRGPQVEASNAPANALDDSGKLRVRMYQVGFGDCFLVSIPQGDDHAHVLIDCGVHAQGHIKDQNGDRITNVVRHIADTTGGKLALVIATHAHQDHISAFASEMAAFEAFDVGEVWLPWLENPRNPVARNLRVKRAALADLLQKQFAATPPPKTVEAVIVNATGIALDAKGAAASSNAKALDLLQSGFRGKATVRYVKAGDSFSDVASIKGLNVRVLAPSTDQSFLSKMDPPTGAHYLRLSEDDDGSAEAIRPFAKKWLHISRNTEGDVTFSDKDRKQVDEAVAVSPSSLAFALDKVLNNTSVVSLFTYARQSLLFPGDAQWGNWLSWLDSATELLANLTYYKVGHHCSMNATPKAAVEAMTKGNVAAMASTQSAPFPSIPAPKLVDALVQQTATQYIQSDWLTSRKGSLPTKFRAGDFWIDYLV